MAVEPAYVSPDEVVLEFSEKKEEKKSSEGVTEADEDLVIVDEDKKEDEGEKKGTDERNLESENATLRQQLLDLGTEIREMRNQLTEREERPAKIAAKVAETGEDGSISDEQLAALIKEHGDNPAVMVRIMRHLGQEEGRRIAMGVRDEAFKTMEYQNWHRELKRTNDSVMAPVYQTNPEMKGMVSDTVKRLALDQHPMGEVLVHFMLDGIKRQKDDGKAADEKSRAEKLEKVKGLDKTRSTAGDKGKPSPSSLTKDQLKVAEKLGVKPELYAKFVTPETKGKEL